MKKWLRMALMLMAVIALLTTAAFAADIDLDISGDKDGRGWEWDASQQTLYLDDADLSKGIFIDGDATIELDGDNYITVDEGAAIYVEGDLTITGRGELTVYAENGDGICVKGDLLIEDTEVVVEYSYDDAIEAEDNIDIINSYIRIEETDCCGIYSNVGDIVIEDSEIEIDYIGYDANDGIDGFNVTILDSQVTILEGDSDGLIAVDVVTIVDSEVWIGRMGRDGVDASDLYVENSAVMVQEASDNGIETYNIEVVSSEIYASGENVALCILDGYTDIDFGGLRLRGSTRDAITDLRRLVRNIDEEVYSLDGWEYTLMIDGEPIRTLTIGVFDEDEFIDLGPTKEKRVAGILSELVLGYGMPYRDVASNAWYYDAVEEAYHEGYMVGVGNATFAPDQPLTRAMLWTVLARLNNASTYSEGVWYEGAQQWAIINGVSDGKNPNEAVSVEELITMVWRNCGNPYRVAYLDGYADQAKVSNWAVDAMKWAKDQGLLRGELLNPQADASRAYTAYVLVGA